MSHAEDVGPAWVGVGEETQDLQPLGPPSIYDTEAGHLEERCFRGKTKQNKSGKNNCLLVQGAPGRKGSNGAGSFPHKLPSLPLACLGT